MRDEAFGFFSLIRLLYSLKLLIAPSAILIFFSQTSRWMCFSLAPVDCFFCLCFVYPLHWSTAFCTFTCKSFVNKRNNPLSFLISKQKFDKWAFYCFDCGAKTIMIICGGCAGGIKRFHHHRQIIFHLCMHLSLGHVANR